MNPIDLEQLSDDLDAVFDRHGVSPSLRITWAVALLGAANDSPYWSLAWLGLPSELSWMKDISRLCSEKLNKAAEPEEVPHDN